MKWYNDKMEKCIIEWLTLWWSESNCYTEPMQRSPILKRASSQLMAQNNVPDSGEIVEILNLGESQLVNPVNTSEQISTNLLSPQRLDNDSAPNSIDPRTHQDLCKENTQPDDQMGRHGSCPCCEINGEAYDSIMCSNCKNGSITDAQNCPPT